MGIPSDICARDCANRNAVMCSRIIGTRYGRWFGIISEWEGWGHDAGSLTDHLGLQCMIEIS